MSVVFPLHLRSNKSRAKFHTPKPISKPVIPVAPIVVKPSVITVVKSEPPEPIPLLNPEVSKPVIEKHNPVKIKASRFATSNFTSTTNYVIQSIKG